MVLDEAAERGHEAAAAAPGDALAVGVPEERDGAAVGDDDELASERHPPTP